MLHSSPHQYPDVHLPLRPPPPPTPQTHDENTMMAHGVISSSSTWADSAWSDWAWRSGSPATCLAGRCAGWGTPWCCRAQRHLSATPCWGSASASVTGPTATQNRQCHAQIYCLPICIKVSNDGLTLKCVCVHLADTGMCKASSCCNSFSGSRGTYVLPRLSIAV